MISVMAFCVVNISRLQLGHDFNTYSQMWLQTHLMLPAINTSISIANMTIVALSFDRFLSICHPFYFRQQWTSARRAKILIICIVLLVIVLHIPYAVYRYSIEVDDSYHCSFRRNDCRYKRVDSPHYGTWSYSVFKLVREFLLKLCPIVVMTYLNARIMYAFRKRKLAKEMKVSKKLSTESSANSKRDEALLLLLLVIVVMFFICNVPAAINLIQISERNLQNIWYQLFRSIANVLESTNHALNFYLFCLCSAEYRKAFGERFPYLSDLYLWLCRRRIAERKRELESSQQETSMIMANRMIECERLLAQEREEIKVNQQPQPQARLQQHQQPQLLLLHRQQVDQVQEEQTKLAERKPTRFIACRKPRKSLSQMFNEFDVKFTTVQESDTFL